jgi:flavin-dependent dehydrogenase
MSGRDQVVIVGGGPAGLAASLALRRRGLAVTVVDGAKPPVEKACGEGLLPETLEALEALGIRPAAMRGVPFRGVRYVGAGRRAEAVFPHRRALGIRRTALHEALHSAAAAAGVELIWQQAVVGLEPGGLRLAAGFLPARWMVGADGQNSRMRRWAGLEARSPSAPRYAFRQHFRVKPWTDFLEVHWNTKGQAYLTPVGEGEVCLAVVSSDRHWRVREALRAFPALERRLLGAETQDFERGALSGNRVWPRVSRGKVALVGDASGTVDAITGEGLGLAFRQALALAEAVCQGDLEIYERTHRRLRRKPQFMASLLLRMARSPFMQRRVLTALAARPELFEKLLALHAGASFTGESAGTGLKLAWGLLTA